MEYNASGHVHPRRENERARQNPAGLLAKRERGSYGNKLYSYLGDYVTNPSDQNPKGVGDVAVAEGIIIIFHVCSRS